MTGHYQDSTGKALDKVLQEFYLSWVNDYISIHAFALDKNITDSEAVELISISRDIHERLINN